MAGLAMAFDIIARDRASKTFKDVGKAADDTGRSVADAGKHGGAFGERLHKGAKAAGVGLIAAGGAAVLFGKQSVDAFTSNTKAAMGMQRAIGGSIEDASRLNFAARESGVSQEALSKSIKLLEKNIASVAGKAGPGAKALASIGVNAKDSTGKIRPMADLLPDIAEKFAKMPNGAEKSALAMKLFGKGGLEMLPMLNKGKEGIKDLMAESDKFGLTVGQKQVDDLKKNIKQQREWHAALDGVKVQVGSAVLPVMTAFSGEMKSRLMPAIHGATQFLMDNKDTIAALTATLIRFLPQILIGIGLFKTITSITKGYTIVQQLLNIAMRMNPIGMVITALGLLAIGLKYAWDHSETFRRVATTAFQKIQEAAAWMWNKVIAPVIRFLINGFSTVADWIGNMLDALSHIPGFGWAKDAADKMHGAAKSAKDIANNIRDIPPTKTVTVEVGLSPKGAKALQAAQARRNPTIFFGGGGAEFSGVLTGALGRPVPQPIGTGWNGYPGHKGYDFLAPLGTPIRAVMNGVVARDGWDPGGFGYHVRTIDADGNMTILGHMTREIVKVGQRVTKGQFIGYSGSTGRSSGPHVHMERRHPGFGLGTAYPFLSGVRGFARGGRNIPAGWALVGEGGPELAYLGRGSAVLPAPTAREVMGGGIHIEQANFYGVQDVKTLARELEDYSNQNGRGIRIKITPTGR
ncbi:phage tail tape measure protein [Terrabacter terrigena]|uniref:Phage tail tape measure protein n=1 Tax=Terrabacter terrigena TaxID=574718 RepID=A0ABW3N157_9MICO